MKLSNRNLVWINLLLFIFVTGSLYVLFDDNLSQDVAGRFATTIIAVQPDAANSTFVLMSSLSKEDTKEPVVEAVDNSGKKQYFVVSDSCAYDFSGECLRVRSGPGFGYEIVSNLRNGAVLAIDELIENEDGTWYKIAFDEWLRYPERVKTDWYVSADFVDEVFDEGIKTVTKGDIEKSKIKTITVDKSEQRLWAHEGSELVLELDISTGLEYTPTPSGTFHIFRKTPTRYMQGPLPGVSEDEYDLPGVPWNMYFTEQGAVIHGAYWHDSFGNQYSHGCVNVSLDSARDLYEWADLGTTVIVKN